MLIVILSCDSLAHSEQWIGWKIVEIQVRPPERVVVDRHDRMTIFFSFVAAPPEHLARAQNNLPSIEAIVSSQLALER